MGEYDSYLKKQLLSICRDREIICKSGALKGDIIKILEADDKKAPKKKVPAKKPKKLKTSDVKITTPGEEMLEEALQNLLIQIEVGSNEKIRSAMKHLITQRSIVGRSNLNPLVSRDVRDVLLRAKMTLQRETLGVDKKRPPIILPTRGPKLSSPKKTISIPIEKPKPYVPKKYKYQEMEVLSFSFGKEGDVIEPSAAISITLEELRKEIEDPEFIKQYTHSVKDLMTRKAQFYRKKLVELTEEYEATASKVKRLVEKGVSRDALKEMFPLYETMTGFIIDMEDLVKIVEERATSTSEKMVKKGLKEAIDDPVDGIASLVGREDVKNKIASQLYSFSKGYKTFFGSFNNIAIYGSAGSGKTKLATTIAFVFSKSGILARNVVKIITKSDLVAGYIGWSGPKTRGVFLQTLEGVIFLDEAYTLTPCPDSFASKSDSFSQESVGEMINFLDKYIGMNITIVGGYEGMMTRCFMPYNEGLPRRFPIIINLAPYSINQLTDILVGELERKMPSNIELDQDTLNFLFSLISKMSDEAPEALNNQAGDMLNLAGFINRSILSAYKIRWENGNLSHNIPIILDGFKNYLSSKGLRMKTTGLR